MKLYLITEEQVRNLAEYLATKPFKEVAGGIQMLNSLPTQPNGEAKPLPNEKPKEK